ncbi:MAG: HNH endonuclease [Spirochaetia bacterium]|nr:HNH endonuclease [Spirochaetia bacterium]
MAKKKDKEYVFRAQDFYDLLESQEYRCALTGRELKPENTTAEHIVPLRMGGRHELKNIYLIDQNVSRLKRYLSEEEVIRAAADIVRYRGNDYGFTLSLKGKKRK